MLFPATLACNARLGKARSTEKKLVRVKHSGAWTIVIDLYETPKLLKDGT